MSDVEVFKSVLYVLYKNDLMDCVKTCQKLSLKSCLAFAIFNHGMEAILWMQKDRKEEES